MAFPLTLKLFPSVIDFSRFGKRPRGFSLKDLAKATGQQPHSVRGFLSGTIGKKMGTPVESFKSAEGDRSYRLSAK